MNGTIAGIFVVFLYGLLVCVVLRALLSWFPANETTRGLARVLNRITSPLIDPVRRVVPPIGMIDLSSMVVVFLLLLMISVVRQAADY